MSNDLYSGLIQPYLRKGKNGEQFWGLYDSLDKVATPDTTKFLEVQISKLRALELNQKYDATNAFLQNVQNNLQQQNNTTENEVNNEVYSRILELMNSGLRGSSINPFKGMQRGLSKIQQKQIATKRIQAIITELQTLLKEVKVNSTISAQMVATLEKRLNVDTWNWDQVPHDYIMEKADLAEALMVDKFNQNPNLRAIVTGAWIDESGQQLIEDAFAFNKGTIQTPFQHGKLSFTIKINGKNLTKSAKSIKDFLDQLDRLNGIPFTVKLSNELYEALRLGADIAGQAKSGLHGQAILNKNIRNSLSLEDVNFDPRLLWNLYEADLQTRTEYFKPVNQQKSTTLTALANYCLSKNVAKTALAANQLYLTAEGFVTASQWMKLNNRYLIFTPSVRSIDGEFLTKRRPYYFID